MKIIIVGTAYPYRGGLAAFNERLAAEYASQGHQVEVYTFTLQYPDFLFPGKTQFSDEPPAYPLKIHRRVHAMNPFNWISVGREINSKQPDKVIFCYWMAFFAPCFATIASQCRAAHTKRIALVHNMVPHEPKLPDRILPRCFVNAMDGFVAMTSVVANDINRFDRRNKPKVVSPHPIYDRYGTAAERDDALHQLGLSPDYRYILFFGLVRKYKGLDLLIRAFADLRLRRFPVKLIVAGEFYEPKHLYIELIRRYGLEELVVLHDHFIADNQVQHYFNAADLVAQTYRSATQSGVSQIAYNFEKPMLVTDVGGLSETIPDGKVGYVVAPEAEAIAVALVDFFEHERLEPMTEHVRKEKQQYEWFHMTEAINSL